MNGDATMRSERCRLRQSLLLAAAAFVGLLLACGVLTTTASAVPSHPFLEVFGSGAQPSFTAPGALAVDQSSGPSGGDLLVVDAGRNEKQRVVITEGGGPLSGSYELTFNGQTTGWTGSGTVTCNGTSTSITSVTTSTGAVAKGELISSAAESCIKPNTTIVSCVPASCVSPTSLNLSQATENNASGGVVNLNADLNFSSTAANVQEALLRLPGVGTGNVTVTEAGATSPIKRLVEFKSNLGASDVPAMSCDSGGLAGGATCTIEEGTASTPQGVIASVQRFKPDGTPHAFAGLGTHIIDGRSGPGGKSRAECESAPELSSCDETPQNRLIFGTSGEVEIAIAPSGSGGGTGGNIYVTQSNAAGGKLIDIFGGDGKYLGQLTHAGATALVEPCGVAVDSAGGVFVGDFSKIYKFTPAANPPVNADAVTTFGTVTQPCSLAVGAGTSAGYLFAKKFGNSELFKIDATTGASQCLVGTGLRIVTTDPDSGHVYAGKASEVIEYDASGACAAALSPAVSVPSTVEGVAVDKTSRTGNLYVSRAGSATIEVYGPLQEPPEVALAPPVTGITGAKATVHAKVNPLGSTVTECKFEYGKSASYGSSIPCDQALPPADSSFHSMSASIDGLLANGTTYHYRFVVKTAANLTVQTDDATFATATTFLTNPATEISDDSATLNGTVRLEGLALTECKFEYGFSASYGLTAPCSPDFSSIPNDSSDHPVAAELSGLAQSTTYHFRLRAANSAGSIVGQDRTFQTLGPPQITEMTVSEVDTTGAKVSAAINPSGFDTTYHLEYGVTASYGSRVPVDFDPFIGSGTDPVKTILTLSGLQAGTTYHYRIVASSEVGTTKAPDRVFRTQTTSCSNGAIRAQQGSVASGLPDCMALEMVSPPRKFGQRAVLPQVSADGDRVRFHSSAALEDPPSLSALGLGGEAYVASRGEAGWSTEPTAPPPALNRGWSDGVFLARSFSPDLSSWFILGSSQENGDFAQGIGQVFRGGIGGVFDPFTPLLVPTDSNQHDRSNVKAARLQAVSRDQSRFYFNMGDQSASYLPGDPSPSGTGADPNTYVAQLTSGGQPADMELLARDGSDKVWGGNCGSHVGGVEGSTLGSNAREQGAVSPDGARVYFSTRPAQPTNSTPGGPIAGSCLPANKLRIMSRVEQPSGPQIAELVPNECGRVSPPCETEAEVNGSDFFQGASLDGTRVYFVTNRQLADADLDGSSTECSKTVAVAGCDLYLYDATEPAGDRLTMVSAGEDVAGLHEAGLNAGVYNGTVGISGDGSHVYFVANGVLTDRPNPEGVIADAGKPNLYVFDAVDGGVEFIGTLASADSGQLWGASGSNKNRAYPVPVTGENDAGEEVGGSGRVLFFQTGASLTSSDADEGRLDVYRYDADADPVPLDCISCEPGGPDSEPFGVADLQLLDAGAKVGTDYAEIGRWVSEDGQTAVFRTAQALIPGATSGTQQGFLWRHGSLFALPGTDGDVSGQALSHDGSTVAFLSFDQLLAQDGDTATDVYAARVDGGFFEQMQPPPCQGEACQGLPTQAPAGPSPSSGSYVGTGNVVPAPPKKKKKKAKHRKHSGKKRQGKHAKRQPGDQRKLDNQGDSK